MRTYAIAVAAVAAAFLVGRLSAQQDVEASCKDCEAERISAAEIAEYVEVAKALDLTDQQVRSIDLGAASVQIALAHRGALAAPLPNSVAEHDLVTEVSPEAEGALSSPGLGVTDGTSRGGSISVEALPGKLA